jgi:hypothetical protein
MDNNSVPHLNMDMDPDLPVARPTVIHARPEHLALVQGFTADELHLHLDDPEAEL